MQPGPPIRILLACQEANAAALLGDLRRAREAMAAPRRPPMALSPRILAFAASSCPRPRQALFAMSVATRSGDPDAALNAVGMADAAWKSGAPWAAGTWAQVRLGAGIAHIMRNDLDGALTEISPVLSLAPKLRMVTITGYATQIDKRLQQRRFRGSSTATMIRRQVKEFNASALSTLRAFSEDD